MNKIFRLIFDHSDLNKFQVWNLRLIVCGLLFTIFSGAIRKWGTSSALVGNAILLLQLVLPFLLVFFFKRVRYLKDSGIILFLYLVFLFGFAVNPLNQSVFHGALGIILHSGFWFLIFIYLDNYGQFPLERLIPFFMVLIFLETFLGVLQYQLPPNHFLNQYSNEGATSIAKVGSAVRVTGTFSYLSGYTAFLMGAGLSLWAISKSNYSIRTRLLFLIVVLVASLLSGSRAALIISLFFSLISISIESRSIHPGKSYLNIMVIFISLVLVFSQSDFIRRAILNVSMRFEGGLRSNEYERRTLGTLTEIWDLKGEYGLFGVGLGATYQGANAIWGESKYARAYGAYEEEPERIIIEGGYILMFFKILLWALLLKKLKATWYFILPLMLIQVVSYPLVFNTYNAFFFFFGLAIIDRTYRLN